jgi:poly(glycerol-phosphate) alpha-glucosyltransferase
MMKAAYLSASLSRRAGGIFEIELALARGLSELGVSIHAHGLRDAGWDEDSARWDGIRTSVYRTFGPAAFGYAPGMLRGVLRGAADLAHLHTMWMYPGIAIHGWARRTGKPYLVTPNGMLEPWALGNAAWKKKLAGAAYEKRMLRDAACLHANTEKELRDIRAYGLRNPVCVIPNGVDLPEPGGPPAGRGGRVKTLLFLGRLHPKKGLVNALRAWAEAVGPAGGGHVRDAWRFVVAGWDQGGHEAELKQCCAEAGIPVADLPVERLLDVASGGHGAGVVFTGPAFGAAKDALLRHADAFILPSLSEGLPMGVLEAWSYGLPVLMTDHCNLPGGFEAGAAIRIGTGHPGGIQAALSIGDGLAVLFEMSDADRAAMGANGRALVERHFSWPRVAAQMREVYEWMLGGGPRPSHLVG